MPKTLWSTAAWRIALWTSLAFSLGTFVAFFIVYVFVAHEIRARSDAWLTGEAQVLARVAQDTPRDNLYDQIVSEVAELAMHEVPNETTSGGERMNAVFFLRVNPAAESDTLFVGPESKDNFWRAIQRAHWVAGVPQSIKIEGRRQSASTFRVVAPAHPGATAIYLGLSEQGDNHILHKLTRRFFSVWAGTVLFGFLISYLSTRRTLQRVERISETVARIGSQDLDERLPEPANSDEISRLAKTFNHMLGRIQESVNQLRTVTDAVAHDLKSPVTSIRGILEGALSADSSEQWRDAVGQAIEGLDRMSSLLTMTLDVAEAHAGALHLERVPVNLSELVAQLVDLYQPAMAERRHHVRTDLDGAVVVEADRGLISRTVSNLLENELVHLPDGCQIDIRLYARDGYAALVLQDDGPGFPSDIASRAFERFVKGNRSPGHGLGLAFVDAVVHAHGGSVKISDRACGGAEVMLSLPLGAIQPA